MFISQGSKVSTARMDMSVTSMASVGGTPAPGSFIGERIVAAHVLRDNFRVIRGYPNRIKERIVWLEV